MSDRDWIDAAVRVFEAGVWPGVVLVGLLILRDHFPAIGRWVDRTVRHRGAELSTPLGSFRVDAPTEALRHEQESIDEFAAAADDPQLKAELARVSTSLASVRAELERVKDEARVALSDPEQLPKLIAERAQALLRFGPSESGMFWFGDGSPMFRFSTPADLALLTAVFKLARKDEVLSKASYKSFMEAAKILRADGFELSTPPFELRAYARAIRAESMHAAWDPPLT